MRGLRSRSSRSVCPGETGIALLRVEDVDRPLAPADLDEAVANGRRGRNGRAARRLHEGISVGEQRRERGRVRTPGAVRCRDVVALDGDLDVLIAVEEVVDRLRPVPTGDDDRGRSKLVNPLCQLAPRSPETGERLSLE